RVLDEYTVPNGPAFTADGTRMYLADSAQGRIDSYEVTPAGEPVARSVFARVDEGNPDGMQVDAEAHLWVAIWGAGRVHRYRPDGRVGGRRPEPTAVRHLRHDRARPRRAR